MHEMPFDQFRRLKDRWERSCHLVNDPNLFDQPIVPALIAINKNPDMVTIWSCQGHVDADNIRVAQGYVMIGSRTPEAVYALYNALSRISPAPYEVSLKMTTRLDTTVRHDENNPVTYPVWNLVWTVVRGQEEEMFKRLIDAAESVVPTWAKFPPEVSLTPVTIPSIKYDDSELEVRYITLPGLMRLQIPVKYVVDRFKQAGALKVPICHRFYSMNSFKPGLMNTLEYWFREYVKAHYPGVSTDKGFASPKAINALIETGLFKACMSSSVVYADPKKPFKGTDHVFSRDVKGLELV